MGFLLEFLPKFVGNVARWVLRRDQREAEEVLEDGDLTVGGWPPTQRFGVEPTVEEVEPQPVADCGDDDDRDMVWLDQPVDGKPDGDDEDTQDFVPAPQGDHGANADVCGRSRRRRRNRIRKTSQLPWDERKARGCRRRERRRRILAKR